MGTRAWAVVALLVEVLGINIAFAADWSLVPAINARSEFNSNLFYDFAAPQSDFIFITAPSLALNYSTDIASVQGILAVPAVTYISHSENDHIDQNYRINGQYQVAPRWILALRCAYVVDSSLQEELTTSGLIITRKPRQSIRVGPGVTYNITERLKGTLNYNIERVTYQDPRFQNYTSQQVGLSLNYPLKNQKTVLIGNVTGAETSYSGNNFFRSLSIYLGPNHKFTENWTVSLQAGVNVVYVDSAIQVQEVPQFPFFIVSQQARLKKTVASPSLNLSTTRSWTNLSITAGYLRSMAASAFGSSADVNNVYLFTKYNFSERLSGDFTAAYYRSTQISQRHNLENDFYSFGPQVTYRVTEKLSTSCGYSFNVRNDITDGLTAKAHVAWLMLAYSYPMHYQK